MTSPQSKREPKSLGIERLDDRLCMAASVGWDGAGQGNASLAYYVGTAPAALGLSQATVEATLETALATWAKVADIVFTQTQRPNQPNSIDFSFRSIDGRGGTLAQAYFPSDVNRGAIAGDVQFDSAESWEVGNGRGSAAFDLLWVAVHEIGHALGLDHSYGAGAVMSHSVSSSQGFAALAAADVDAILRLYAPSDSRVLPTQPTSPAQNPALNPGLNNTNTPTGPTRPTSPPSTPRYQYYFAFRRYWRSFSSWRNSLNPATENSVPRIAGSAPESWWSWSGFTIRG